MRYPALAGAAIFVHECLRAGHHGRSRGLVASVLLDADDPGHLLAYWTGTFGRPIPKPLKRGIADALGRLGTRRPLSYPQFLLAGMTIDGGSGTPRPFSLDDVVKLVHPRVLPPPARPGPEPSLEHLVRNLRRFDATGVPFETAMRVAARLSDPGEIRDANLLPLRLHAAREAIAHQRWAPPLERAGAHLLDTLPKIPGRTLLVLEHTAPAAVVFGLTLAQACTSADVITTEGVRFEVVPGESPLHGLHRWQAADLPSTHQASVPAATEAYASHARVVLCGGYVDASEIASIDLPAPIYAWSTDAYEPDPVTDPTRDRLAFRGVTDAAYQVIPWIESPTTPF
jgi:hypothetical protein